MQLDGGMNVHDIARTYQACIVEVRRLEEQRVERSEISRAGRAGIAARHVSLYADPRAPSYSRERVALRRSQRPRKNISPRESSRLQDRLDVVVKACAGSEYANAHGMPRLRSGLGDVARVVVSESQVIHICTERRARRERWRRSVDAPEKLPGDLVVELRLSFPSRPRNESVCLRAGVGGDELSAVELERNVRRLASRHQPPRAVCHGEPPAAEHDVSWRRCRVFVETDIRKCLLEVDFVLIHRRRLTVLAKLQ